MIKGVLSFIGLFIAAALVLFIIIFIVHRVWVTIKGDRDIIDWKDSLKMTMMIFTITVASLAFIIMFIL